MFLVGEGDCVLSQVLNKSLAEQRQHEEAKKGALKRVEQAKENNSGTIYYTVHSESIQHFVMLSLMLQSSKLIFPPHQSKLSTP